MDAFINVMELKSTISHLLEGAHVSQYRLLSIEEGALLPLDFTSEELA